MVIFFIIKRTVWDRYLQVVIVKLDAINVAKPILVDLFYRHGAEAARGAHNSEDLGSKPSVGILVLAKLIAWCRQYLTGMAQRKRAENTVYALYDRKV